jgi:hypothetical protein
VHLGPLEDVSIDSDAGFFEVLDLGAARDFRPNLHSISVFLQMSKCLETVATLADSSSSIYVSTLIDAARF